VRLEGIMSSSRLISVRPAAILRCPMAESVAQWVRADLDPILGELEAPPVAAIDSGNPQRVSRSAAWYYAGIALRARPSEWWRCSDQLR
jgi:hypothetical protein